MNPQPAISVTDNVFLELRHGHWPGTLTWDHREFRLFRSNTFTHKLVSVEYIAANGDQLVVVNND